MKSSLLDVGQRYEVQHGRPVFHEAKKRMEQVLEHERPDMLLRVRDVNSTMAKAGTAAKLCIPMARAEAGLRCLSGHAGEITRLFTEVTSDYLFVTEESGMRMFKPKALILRKYFSWARS